MAESPPFQCMIRASGQGEVWTHVTEHTKFDQYGWRSRTREDAYGKKILVGNWNEESFDIKQLRHAKQLPSQFNHNYRTIYGDVYNTIPKDIPQGLKHLKFRPPFAFPGHQPELDTPQRKADWGSWLTTSRAAYIDPAVRQQPVGMYRVLPPTPKRKTQH